MNSCSACLRASILAAMMALTWPAQAADSSACETEMPDARATADCDAQRAALLATMTVSATLNPRPLGEVAADVSVITREQMDRHLVDSLQDLVRYEPGVSVTSTPGRFGESGFSIRGLGGNRVRIEVDGVSVADAFSFGALLSAGRNMVDMDSLQRVEIVRGPASSLYGSDALGGVVSYVTKDPADYLRDGRPAYVSVKHQYSGANCGKATSATFAAGGADYGFMLLTTHRDASQSNNMGTVDSADASRTRPDPQRLRSDNVLTKYVHNADTGRTDRLTLDVQRSNTRTNLLSSRGPSTSDLDGAVWQINQHFNAYTQYASGFRAPPYSDLGLLFSNLGHGYAAIPNPELKPETSRSFELGLRGEAAVGRFTVAVYSNRYDNFIDSEHMLARADWPEWAASTPGLAIVFQSVNLTRARIRGVEASGVLYLGQLSETLDGWQLRGNVGAARGDAHEHGEPWTPLDSVDPSRAVLGIGYEAYDWGIELDATAVSRKQRLDNDDAFRAPGYATLDLYTHWSPLPSLKLWGGLTNIGNRRYWNWGSLHGGTLGSTVDTSAVIDRYSSSGRALSVAAKWTF